MTRKKHSQNNSQKAPAHAHESTYRAQLVWSVCVALVVAFVVLQQAMGSRLTQTAPQTLVTGKPVPFAADDHRFQDSK